MRLVANNTYTGTTIVSGGTLQIDGSQPQSAVNVQDGGRLQGSGTVANISYGGIVGTIAPGAGPGILTCSSFNPGAVGSGTLEIEVNGTTPGTGYDQIHALGSVWLNGVALDARLNFASKPSDEFTIIAKDGTGPVTGTFKGLSEGTNFYIGGELFYITYAGGTGNDVVLTRLPTPTPPSLSISTVSASLLVLSWPTNDPAYTLQSTTDLAANNWASVSSPPVIVGSNFVVSNTPAGPQKFYRLIR